MATLSIMNKQGKQVGTVELNPTIFEAKYVKRLLDLVTRLYANNKRTGNAHTKTRAEVRGGGKKPWKQKGTGRARVSSIRSPLWRGGGTVFGPRKRDIYNTIPQKVRMRALVAALTQKVRDGNLVLVDDLSVKTHKTKEFYAILEALKIDNRKTMMLVQERADMMSKATRNIEKLKVERVSDVNAYQVMRKHTLLIDKTILAALEKRILEGMSKKKAA